MQPPSCAARHPILASVGVPVLAAIVAYWWSAAAVVVIAATGCACVTLQRWWRFEVAAHRNETALLNAAEHELDAAEQKLVKRDDPRTQRLSRR
jgi:protein-S-isoprenylcysteine O-methyltransferase Ste14